MFNHLPNKFRPLAPWALGACVSLALVWLPSVSASSEAVTNPFELATASVIIADPRATTVSFPGVVFGAGEEEPNAMLCFSQVDQTGTAISPATVNATGTTLGVTRVVGEGNNFISFSGARSDVETFSSQINLEAVAAGQSFGVQSVYIRVIATPDTEDDCNSPSTYSVSRNVEVRFLNMLKSSTITVLVD